MPTKEQKLQKEARDVSRVEEDEFRAIVPSTGFLGQYMHYTDKQESPGSFHFWTAVTIIGGVLQRRAWVSKGVYKVFPNLYTILVAPTGKCRKSASMRLGLELVDRFEYMNILADKTTPEALLEALQLGSSSMEKKEEESNTKIQIVVDSCGFIKASELSVFLNKNTYSSGMVSLLTDLYDCPSTYKYVTRNKSPVLLQDVAVSLLGASTPDWLATSIPEAAFEGGFMSRVMFVVKEERDRSIPFPIEPEKDEKANLRRELQRIRKHFRGEIILTKEAREWFRSWYENGADLTTGDNQLVGFVERKPDTLLKLAIILAAAENPAMREIHIGHLKQASRILNWTQTKMFKAFEHVNLSPFGQVLNAIHAHIARLGSVPRREVLRKYGRRLQGLKQLEEVEEALMDMGILDIDHIKPEGGGRIKTVYRYIGNGQGILGQGDEE